MINKDTLLFGSFSKKAGNIGCIIFNKSFLHYNINAIYKSFSINNLSEAIISAKCLGFSGFAVSMPYKKEIIPYLNSFNEIVKKTESCNTVIIKNGELIGFNTDYYSIYDCLLNTKIDDKTLFILGNGAYSRNVEICCQELKINYQIITRENWNKIILIQNAVIFNCTPVENITYDLTNIFIDCNINTVTGKKLALKQASIQFEIYTDYKFPKYITYNDL
jgi:shikimate 5-dehydrogenase